MNPIKDKLLVGITGGIGSGKTVLCKMLANRGFKVIFADLIAKELYVKDKTLLNKVVKQFGNEVLNYQGKINLAKLREIIFSNKTNYDKITRIVHPAAIDYIFQQVKKSRDKIILIESALIFESGLNKKLDYTILVYTNKKTRIERTRLRDQTSKKDIEKIMKFQMDEKEKVEKADFVIVNNKTLEDLKPQVDFLTTVLKSLQKRN